MLRGLATDLLWYGKITTTEARAKELRGIVDSLLTLAINNYDKTVKVTKEIKGKDGVMNSVEFENDAP